MHLEPVNKVAFSPDGRRLRASAAADGQKLGTFTTGLKSPKWMPKSLFQESRFHHRRLDAGATAGGDGAAKLWDAAGFDLRLMSSPNDVSGMPTEGKNLVVEPL